MLLYVMKITVAICVSQSRIQLSFPPKLKKLDWARSQNGYFDKFSKDMRHQIVIIIGILHNYAI